jgi:hypothetical protein
LGHSSPEGDYLKEKMNDKTKNKKKEIFSGMPYSNLHAIECD